jgi:hypothetical protein
MKTGSLRKLYLRHREQVQFLMVYIREAHPRDGWWLGGGVVGVVSKVVGLRAATDVHDPQTLEARRAVAGRCEDSLQYDVPTYVDEMDDAVNEAYAAWPTRLYLVGLDGRVVYAGGLGPFGFSPAALGAAIDEYLGENPPATRATHQT